MYPSGMQCTNPIPKYIDPLLCGGHCDNIKPPKSPVEGSGTRVKLETTLGQTEEALPVELGTEVPKDVVDSKTEDNPLDNPLDMLDE